MIVILIALVLIVAIMICYIWITKNYNYWKDRNIPYIKPTFPFGNFKDMVFFRFSIGEYFQSIYNASKESIVGIWVFGEPMLIIRSPAIIKQILIKDFINFRDRTVLANEEADPICANMLFFSKNPQWRTMRQKMSPLLTILKLKDMIFLMNKSGDDMLHYMSKNACKVYDLKEICMDYTVDFMASISFGISASCFEKKESEFKDAANSIFLPSIGNYLRFGFNFMIPTIAKWFKLPFFDLKSMDFFRKTFWNVINQRNKDCINRRDLINSYIKLMKSDSFNGYKFEGDKVVGQAVQFFAAGFETTSITIAYTLYELSLHQTIQDKLREEICLKYVPGSDVTYELLKDLTYLGQVVSESLRKYPALAFLDRRCCMNYKIPNTDFILEKGTAVYISVFGLHYDPEFFPNPYKFDPDRFSPENIKSINLDAYIPFGNGPRGCLGKRLGLIGSKLCLIKLLSEYKVEPCLETTKNLKFDIMSFTTSSSDGFKLKFTKL
nr:cytochrome P450 6g1-like [Nicrophorus vespilloides]